VSNFLLIAFSGEAAAGGAFCDCFEVVILYAAHWRVPGSPRSRPSRLGREVILHVIGRQMYAPIG
jgi:hypothetical protein